MEAVRSVRAWVAELSPAKREAFLDACEHTFSPVELWLYARTLGLEQPFEDLQAYATTVHPQVSRRRALQAEVVQIQNDLRGLRTAAAALQVKPDVATARITQLTKELRAHIKAIDDMTNRVERRGLILAGADKLARELQRTFQGDERFEEPLEAAIEAAWLTLSGEV